MMRDYNVLVRIVPACVLLMYAEYMDRLTCGRRYSLV